MHTDLPNTSFRRLYGPFRLFFYTQLASLLCFALLLVWICFFAVNEEVADRLLDGPFAHLQNDADFQASCPMLALTAFWGFAFSQFLNFVGLLYCFFRCPREIKNARCLVGLTLFFWICASFIPFLWACVLLFWYLFLWSLVKKLDIAAFEKKLRKLPLHFLAVMVLGGAMIAGTCLLETSQPLTADFLLGGAIVLLILFFFEYNRLTWNLGTEFRSSGMVESMPAENLAKETEE